MSVNELMTGLADSVRLKTGKTEEMNLEQIAAAITGITVSGDIGFTCGTVSYVSSGAKTIQHNLGQVPGAVLLIKLAAHAGTPSSSTSISDLLFSGVYGAEVGCGYCYHYSSRYSSQTSSNRSWLFNATIPSYMFGSGQPSSPYYISNINGTSFKTPSYLTANKKYLWIAFRAPLA